MDRDQHTRRGKWSEAGVPKKGWTCVGGEDLEEPRKHTLAHPQRKLASSALPTFTLKKCCSCGEWPERRAAPPRRWPTLEVG